MKRLTCEMCGSTDLVKENGVFVCKVCGCQYSIEEAKKMMIEGTVEVTGTVRVDDSFKKQEQIDNYYEMAQTCLESNDVEGVVSYCDRILEIDRDNYRAWVMKAKVAGWGSSLDEIKIPQAISAAKRAVALAPDEKKYDVAAEIYYTTKVQLMLLLDRTKLLSTGDGISGCRKVMNQWLATLNGIPFLSKDIMEKEINNIDDMVDESRGSFMPGNRYLYASTVSYGKYGKIFREKLADKMATEEKREEGFRAKAKEEADAKRKAYWLEHPDLEEELNRKKTEAELKINEYNLEIEKIEEKKELNVLQEQWEAIDKEASNLGIFKVKEKKELQAKADIIHADISKIKTIVEQKENNLKEKIHEQENVLSEIDKQLNLDL